MREGTVAAGLAGGAGGVAEPTLTLTVEGSERQTVLAELFRTHGLVVWRWATHLGCSRSDAQDVTQEVFLAANRRLRKMPREPAELNGWLFGMTRRAVYEQRKREQREVLTGSEAEAGFESEPYGFAERRMEQRQTLRTFYRLLDSLREVERTALLLHDVEGLSGREAAKFMQLPEATFWNHVLRGRLRVRRCWEAQRQLDAAAGGEGDD